MAIASCAPKSTPNASANASSPTPLTPALNASINTDACAMRMHEMCGAFLLYYAIHSDLPQQLSDLTTTPGLDAPLELKCPLSGADYIYNPAGIFMPEGNARIIAYDATPAHLDHRWAISINEPQAGEPLVARVVGLPESFFVLQRAR